MKVKQTKGTNLPGAWIINPKNKGRKSIKGDKIYLDNGQEFEIEIFNPLKESVLADIRLNGNSICKTGLVVKPGQRIYLDCFVDDKKKFIFQTYQVDDTQESLEAIEDNGLMEVFFYKEQAVTLQNWNDRFHKVIIHEYHPVYYPVYPRWYPTYYTIGNGSITTGGTITITGTGTITGNANITGAIFNTSNSGSGISFTNCSLTSGSSAVGSSYNNSQVAGSLETGRVEKGEKSNQQFVDVDMEFEKNYIHHLVFQLLPESRKPVSASDVVSGLKSDTTKKKKSGTSGNWPHQYENNTDGIVELIKKLADLHSAGILTDEEFSEKKSELLSKI